MELDGGSLLAGEVQSRQPRIVFVREIPGSGPAVPLDELLWQDGTFGDGMECLRCQGNVVQGTEFVKQVRLADFSPATATMVPPGLRAISSSG